MSNANSLSTKSSYIFAFFCVVSIILLIISGYFRMFNEENFKFLYNYPLCDFSRYKNKFDNLCQYSIGYSISGASYWVPIISALIVGIFVSDITIYRRRFIWISLFYAGIAFQFYLFNLSLTHLRHVNDLELGDVSFWRMGGSIAWHDAMFPTLFIFWLLVHPQLRQWVERLILDGKFVGPDLEAKYDLKMKAIALRGWSRKCPRRGLRILFMPLLNPREFREVVIYFLVLMYPIIMGARNIWADGIQASYDDLEILVGFTFGLFLARERLSLLVMLITSVSALIMSLPADFLGNPKLTNMSDETVRVPLTVYAAMLMGREISHRYLKISRKTVRPGWLMKCIQRIKARVFKSGEAVDSNRLKKVFYVLVKRIRTGDSITTGVIGAVIVFITGSLYIRLLDADFIDILPADVVAIYFIAIGFFARSILGLLIAVLLSVLPIAILIVVSFFVEGFITTNDNYIVYFRFIQYGQNFSLIEYSLFIGYLIIPFSVYCIVRQFPPRSHRLIQGQADAMQKFP